MPYQHGVNQASYYNNIGAIYPVQIKGIISGTIYGTAKYTYGSSIATAATHMGFVNVGETDTVYIKIIEFPEGGYKASRMNNITSNSYTQVQNGYVFVDEDGNEILEPVITPNATLSGYDVYPNGNYYFEQLGDSVISSDPYRNKEAESYIELDLSEYSKEDMIKVSLNMEIDGYYYGCATITKTKDQTPYNSGTGRFIYVYNTQDAKTYETIIPGGEKYYLHLISYYYNSSWGSSLYVKFNSLEVTQIPADKKPTITIDENAVPIEYNGELWYPNGTKVTIGYIEDDCNYTNIGLNSKNYLWYKRKYEISDSEYSYTTAGGNYTITLTEPMTIWAKYGENSPEETLKINIMPNVNNIGSTYANKENSEGNIYPVVVTGTNSGSIYGNNVYLGYYYYSTGYWSDTRYSNIATAATHMGLVDIGETKTVYIKIVKSPVGGYAQVNKNNIESKSATDVLNGFMFVTADGREILEPIIESATATIGSESTIVVTANAVGQNGAEVQKYYYSIDNGPYIETTENTYTFTDIESYKTHTVKVYVRDELGAVSQTKEIVTSVVSNNVTPTITLDENAVPIEYNGELWYPYGTQLTISFAEDMTNLKGYYTYIDERTGSQSGWTTYTSSTPYTTTLNYSVTYLAKIADSSGKETEVARKTIRIMPNGTNGAYYYSSYIGNVYPVQVTGTTSGNACGEDVYEHSSNVSTAATHMGLIGIDETKELLIKIVPAPVGGYKGTLRNGVGTNGHTNTYNGYVFIDENGNGITTPKVNSVVTTSGDDSITVTVNAESSNANIEEYYYSIDNGEYVKTTSNIYTFNEIQASGNRTIKVYVKDENGNLSSIKSVNGHINTPIPEITFSQEPIIYNGEKWYPYNTTMYIDFFAVAQGYYRSINVHTNSMSSWTNSSRVSLYSTTLTESMIYEAYNYNSISGESEHIREKINIMPNPDSLQTTYYDYGSGKIYPVQVTGKNGNGYGTDTYCAYYYRGSYFTPIGVAAVHQGLLQVGETKTLYIKIVPCPEGGYIGSTRNGITTYDLTSVYKGYVFVQ